MLFHKKVIHPKDNTKITCNIAEKKTTDKVFGKANIILSQTGLPLLKDCPKSREKRFLIQLKYCSYRGLSKPNLILTSSICSGDGLPICLLAYAVAGSTGDNFIKTNDKILTINNVIISS